MRKRLVNLHLWFGMTVGLFWALQGLSGALLVFHRDLYRAAAPSAHDGEMASLDLIRQRAETAASSPIKRIGVFDPRGDILWADYEDSAGVARTKLVGAARAEILASRETEPSTPKAGSIWPWIYRFHDSLAGGANREAIVGASGLLLLSSLVVGLWIGWPKRRAWGVALDARRWKSTNQRLYGWHRGIGLIISLMLLVTVPCGIYMVFGAKLRPLVAQIVPHSLPYRAISVSQLPDRLITAQMAYEIAHRHFPAAAFVSVVMPSPKVPVYTVRLRQAAELRSWAGLTMVVVDARSGQTLYVYNALRAPISNRILDAAFPVHTGEFAGVPGRILILLLGLSLPTLYVTGVWMWARRFIRRKKKRLVK